MTASPEQFAADFLLINQSDLSMEVVRHSSLYFEAAKNQALANSSVDYMKAKFEKTGATVTERTRVSFAARGEKITETRLSSLVLLDAEYIRAHTELLAAKKEAAVWQATKDSFMSRGFMLRDLCNLTLSEYSAQTSVRDVKTEEGDPNRKALARTRRAIKRREVNNDE